MRKMGEIAHMLADIGMMLSYIEVRKIFNAVYYKHSRLGLGVYVHQGLEIRTLFFAGNIPF